MRRQWRGFHMLALALATLYSAAYDAEAKDTFRLGVRTDARPFVYADGGTYAGFLYDMCRAAMAFAQVEPATVEVVPVTAADRFATVADGGLDLLCDPTTLTMERVKTWNFSPIVFFANSVTLQRNRPVVLSAADAPPGCSLGNANGLVLVGWVDHTTSDDTVMAVTTDLPRGPDQVAVCPLPFMRHDDGIRDICSDDGRLSFYVGDADILSAQVEAMRRDGLPCRVTFNVRAARPEPYALVLGTPDAALRQRLTAGIYAFFRNGGAERSFSAAFGVRMKSPILETLFRLNALP